MSTITAARTLGLDPAPAALGTSPATSRLGRYTERDTGAMREIVRLPLADGNGLVIDRLSDSTATHACSLALKRMSRARTRRFSAPCISRMTARAAAGL